jgi:hypothetical protein
MKLHSQEKLKDVQLRITTNEKIASLLEQYVVYANTQLGHRFADVKELTTEVLRAFVEEDRGFKVWRETGAKEQAAVVRPAPKEVVQQESTPMFENGRGAK